MQLEDDVHFEITDDVIYLNDLVVGKVVEENPTAVAIFIDTLLRHEKHFGDLKARVEELEEEKEYLSDTINEITSERQDFADAVVAIAAELKELAEGSK